MPIETVVTPEAGDRVVYVSSSAGNDAGGIATYVALTTEKDPSAGTIPPGTEIAKQIGVSQMQVSRIIRQAVSRLRAYASVHEEEGIAA
mgnify:CR=1 FL=1